MNIRIEKSTAAGSVAAFPSKSAAHRALICAALCRGKSEIKNFPVCDDTLATLDCIRVLGAKATVSDGEVTVFGGGMPSGDPFLCRESGSTLRFIMATSLLFGGGRFVCSGRLSERTLGDYERIFTEKGISFSKSGNEISVCGSLESGEYVLSGGESSQFASGLLFALPTLAGDSRIVFENAPVSRPYIDMTFDMLRKFGVNAEWNSEREISVQGGQRYSACDVDTEGDFSSSACLYALNFLGGDVKITGLDENSRQADRAFYTCFGQIDAGFCEIDISGFPDLAPVLMALGAAKHGVKLRGTARLCEKESDRGRDMAAELEKFGARCAVGDDEITVFGGEILPPTEAIDPHRDHRIAMACAVLLTLCGGEVADAECVGKSFPDFFGRLSSLGVKVFTKD